ncbi:hypothetical protein MMC14_005915 [Varicellaria rhodocarpa]|nr:hypothetical protein [Varicellaria rhodocarpa]
MAASAAPGKGPPDENFLEALRMVMREVDRLVNSGKDVDAIIHDTDSVLESDSRSEHGATLESTDNDSVSEQISASDSEYENATEAVAKFKSDDDLESAVTSESEDDLKATD